MADEMDDANSPKTTKNERPKREGAGVYRVLTEMRETERDNWTADEWKQRLEEVLKREGADRG